MTIEFAILLNYEEQLKKNSEMEKELFQSIIDQLKETKMSKIENSLIWLYAKSWGFQGHHMTEKSELWKFGEEDLKTAVEEIVFSKTNPGQKLQEQLQELILKKFENKTEFHKWAEPLISDASWSTIQNALRANTLVDGKPGDHILNKNPGFLLSCNRKTISASVKLLIATFGAIKFFSPDVPPEVGVDIRYFSGRGLIWMY